MRPLKILEHCAQKWIPDLRKNNATTQDPRALWAKVGPVLRKNNAATQDPKAFLRFKLKAKTL
jgi:hypothetical protein